MRIKKLSLQCPFRVKNPCKLAQFVKVPKYSISGLNILSRPDYLAILF